MSADAAKDRPTLIAEAAIEILAQHGARGLTHRAIDAELALPAGSASYYLPTRMSLLLSAARRLVELDAVDVAASTIDADGVVALVERWVSPQRRSRSLARMELLLTSARDPAFAFMQKARKAFVDAVAIAATGHSQAAATKLVAFVDGLILHGLVVGELKRDELRRALEPFLEPERKSRSRDASAKRQRVG